MFRYLEARTHGAVWVFDLVDAYLKRLHGPNSHPRPVAPLVFELVAREVGGEMVPLPAAREPELVIVANAGGYYLFFGRERIRGERLDDETQRSLLLQTGTYLVRVSGPGYQPLQLEVTLPAVDAGDPDPDPWTVFAAELQPASGYPFPHAAPYRADEATPCGVGVAPASPALTRLRGGLFHTDGRGLQGATAEVTGRSNTYTVGQDGQWVLWFDPGDDTVTGLHTVTFTLPDGATIDVPGVCVVRGRETSLPATALRGWVLRDGVGLPGATIEVAGFAQTVTSREDGSWRYFFPPDQADRENVSVEATLPDGQSMSAITRIKSRGTVVVPSFTFA